MDIDQYNKIVLEYRDSMVLIGCISLALCLATMLILTLVCKRIGLTYIKIAKLKVSPSLLLLVPLFAMIIYFSSVVVQCNLDIFESSFVTYVGICKYESETVILEEENLRIYVGNGHELVPSGRNYGKCVYSKHAKVIVFWEAIDQHPENSH